VRRDTLSLDILSTDRLESGVRPCAPQSLPSSRSWLSSAAPRSSCFRNLPLRPAEGCPWPPGRGRGGRGGGAQLAGNHRGARSAWGG